MEKLQIKRQFATNNSHYHRSHLVKQTQFIAISRYLMLNQNLLREDRLYNLYSDSVQFIQNLIHLLEKQFLKDK